MRSFVWLGGGRGRASGERAAVARVAVTAVVRVVRRRGGGVRRGGGAGWRHAVRGEIGDVATFYCLNI